MKTTALFKKVPTVSNVERIAQVSSRALNSTSSALNVSWMNTDCRVNRGMCSYPYSDDNVRHLMWDSHYSTIAVRYTLS